MKKMIKNKFNVMKLYKFTKQTRLKPKMNEFSTGD